MNDCIHLYVMTTDVAAYYMVHQRYAHLVLQVLTVHLYMMITDVATY